MSLDLFLNYVKKFKKCNCFKNYSNMILIENSRIYMAY